MRIFLVLAFGLIVWTGHSTAQSYPTRPVRVVVGFAPGGGPDIVARLVSDPLGARLKQSVVVDNRAGANGIIGADIVSKASPDGHTLLVTSASFAINPSTNRKLPFDPVNDFTPVTNLANGGGLFLAVNPVLPVKTVAELIAYNNATRAGILPDVPTVAEAGLPGTVIDGSWYGLFAPPRTPTAIVAKLLAEVRGAINDPRVREKLAATGLEPDGQAPAQFKAFVENAIKRNAEAVRAARIEPQ